MSPMTSLQNEETRFALRMSLSASAASGTLRDAIEWNGVSSADVTATPMMSKIIPIRTIAIRIRNETARLARPSSSEETKDIVPEMSMVRTKIRMIHL